jgi:hypothetical protein
MNFAALRKQNPDEAIPVLYQYSEDDAFDPRMLIMAYEEEGRVVPVVSDFDCFLIGSRNFSFEDSMSQDQIELVEWCVSQIEWILGNQSESGQPGSWTSEWLEILKYAATQGFYPKMPTFGFGDPTSYALIEAAVGRSKKSCGAVRHGPECFNFFFPQELDEELLVIYPGSKKWEYVSVAHLQDILIEKIKEGFSMPLNPKWILCDPGWINVFIELLKSRHPSVRHDVNMWYPADSGLRDRIISITKAYPNGFIQSETKTFNASVAIQQYERFLILQRAKQKCRGFIYWNALLKKLRNQPESERKENLRVSINKLNIVPTSNMMKALSKQASMTGIETDVMDSIERTDFFSTVE